MELERNVLDQLVQGKISKAQASQQLRWARRHAQASASLAPVAIIGLAGRFPGAASIDELWRLLADGKSAISPVPEDRWDMARYHDPDRSKPGKTPSRFGGFLDGIDHFDPFLFKIAPRDAAAMDPQDRIILQVAWELFEDAGYSVGQIKSFREAGGRVGTFVGACFQQYGLFTEAGQSKADALVSSFGGMVGRLSQAFDLNGPSIAIDSACSSAMMAMNQALVALDRGDCQMALAGGVNLTEHPLKMVGLKHLLGTRDFSSPFAEGDGYLTSEGAGLVLLKPLAAALQDGDNIHGVIIGSAVGHSGQGGGYRIPSAREQREICARALSVARATPGDIDYVESAAMGLPAADVAELDALTALFPADEERKVMLGSVKSNLGHAEAASTMAQLAKVLLQFKHSTLVPTLNCRPLHPSIEASLATSALQLSEVARGWDGQLALLHSVGAMGASGALVVQAFRLPADAVDDEEGVALVPLSASRPELLAATANRLADYLKRYPQLRLANVAYTLQSGRTDLKSRHVLAVRSIPELINRLRDLRADDAMASVEEGIQQWLGGASIDWSRYSQPANRKRISLPGIVQEARRLWVQQPDADETIRTPTGALQQPGAKSRDSGSAIDLPVVVIGAGPAGIATAKSLLEEGLRPIVLERSKVIGGIWTYREDYHGGPYKSTQTQNSKHTFFYSDFPPLDTDPLFCNVDSVQAYFQRYIKHFNLASLIQLESQVLQVAAEGANWRVTYYQASKGVQQILARGVACCTGEFWEPQVSQISGRERFRGLQITSSAYHSGALFTDKTVCVIGSGVSGADIAADAVENASKVHWSIRNPAWFLPRMTGFVPNDCSQSYVARAHNRERSPALFVEQLRQALPDYMKLYEQSGLLPTVVDTTRIHINDRIVGYAAQQRVEVCPSAVAVDENGVIFADGSRRDVDVIVYATGFVSPRYEYLRPLALNDFSRRLFYRENPSLFICNHLPGASGFGAALPYFELMARWYAGALSGRYALGEGALEGTPWGADGNPGVFDTWTESLEVAQAIGVLPDPLTEWAAYWQFINMPPIPVLFRVQGPHAWAEASAYAAKAKRGFFVRQDELQAQKVKNAVLAGLGESALASMVERHEIGAEEQAAALAYRGRRMTPWLAWQEPQNQRLVKAAQTSR
ncbi:beta-ketoacyl synthase N-terminal-like domain-containing protein [Pseudomonas syringae group genomosp. 3]|uniref:beta-ketoacyl synthase N-terminal-like domain-containing protein n=1 Tax=Pseudomonas syringae group genomosp. 3 TaxID=251701 RepID=UPI0006E6639A|nr:beta-ketoacyl synthase N-terminal-like domain-containing protein [Pseudomonas syringae group genomosp. 3]KPW48673.1 Amino acid adenylation enzyme/thioester reductase family protein [Pseudomonas syringae pv. berberidis]RMP69494.1 Amino acid adenylation enzyme/thioester reductase protein [Pseudomonas syringae pv. berberidis]RMQ45463.1 Amino acid adenylation enzyme/thioester reductase protein [Pseudomonas syringae pv. berberidis]